MRVRTFILKAARTLYRFFFRRMWSDLATFWLVFTHRLSARWSRLSGVTAIKRDQELIVSLTTIPERISTVHLCIDCLLRQSLKPDRIILWLSESNDPAQSSISRTSLPSSLTKLQKRGLEIRWCVDIRSYRKIIPTLRAFPNALIVTADDDIFYPHYWLQPLYEAYQREPEYIHCHRAHKIKYGSTEELLPYHLWEWMAPSTQGPSIDLFPTSGGGVLYTKNHLHEDVLNEKVFMAICPKADDVWLKVMSILANVPCKKVNLCSLEIVEMKFGDAPTLASENVTLGGNDRQIKAVSEYYGLLLRPGYYHPNDYD